MEKNKTFNKTIVIRITDDQYKKLINSVKLLTCKKDDDLINKSMVIREMMDKYLVPRCRNKRYN
jgi:hypothetical protein